MFKYVLLLRHFEIPMLRIMFSLFLSVKQKLLTCILHEHKPFWRLRWSNEYNIDGIPKGYSEPSQTSKMKLLPKIVDS